MPKPSSCPGAAPRLRGSDLPLLVSLDLLLEECNVTRAAARLRLSQPAMSAQLARLRLLFGDPLLVPAGSGRGLAPSPFARRLQRRLRPALAALDTALRPAAEPLPARCTPEGFDPGHAVRSFHIVATESAAAAIVPGLAGRMHAHGNQHLRLTQGEPVGAALAGMLEKGEVDLCLGAYPPAPDLLSCVLMTTPYMLVQRRGHPRGAAPVSLDAYCMLDHVGVTRDDSLHGVLDQALSRLGQARHVKLSLCDAGTAVATVALSELVCTLPASMGPLLPSCVEMVALDFTFPRHALSMAWHPGSDDEPGLRWLREQALALAADSRGRPWLA